MIDIDGLTGIGASMIRMMWILIRGCVHFALAYTGHGFWRDGAGLVLAVHDLVLRCPSTFFLSHSQLICCTIEQSRVAFHRTSRDYLKSGALFVFMIGHVVYVGLVCYTVLTSSKGGPLSLSTACTGFVHCFLHVQQIHHIRFLLSFESHP